MEILANMAGTADFGGYAAGRLLLFLGSMMFFSLDLDNTAAFSAHPSQTPI